MLKVLGVETTNLCNSQCIFCAHSQLKKFGIMSDHLYQKIVNEASKISPPLVTFIASNIGEPLLDPDIIERLYIARRKLSPSTKISLFTNGSGLNDDIISAFAKIPNFVLTVSINGASMRTRKRLMGLDDYDKVVEYTQKAINIGINCNPSLVNYDVSTQETIEFRKMWKKGRFILNPLNFAGSTFKDEPYKGACDRAIYYMTILWDGRVNLCCMDVPERIVFGNVNKNTIEEIWNTSTRQKYIRLHLQGKGQNLKVCEDCNHPRNVPRLGID